MTDAKHTPTPGPWFVGPQEWAPYTWGAEIVVPTGESDSRYKVLASTNANFREQALADARLIAAAPELLAVAELVLAKVSIEMPGDLIEAAVKAIAKVKGIT